MHLVFDLLFFGLLCLVLLFVFLFLFCVCLFVSSSNVQKMGEVVEGYSKKPKNFFEILHLKWMQYTYAAGFR